MENRSRNTEFWEAHIVSSPLIGRFSLQAPSSLASGLANLDSSG